jgi:hypothetical protein
MADASRFPRLVVPFTIVGACAGWLSAGLVRNPLLGFSANQAGATVYATLAGALTGALLTRACVGRRYHYEIGDPDPEVRPGTDRWFVHLTVVIAAGALTGWVLAATTPRCTTELACAFGGAICAAAFAPVCLAVIAAARRAQRARMGSIVADSDRRAVWGILAATLGVMTLEAVPDWLASRSGGRVEELTREPLPALTMFVLAVGCTAYVLLADRRALARARAAASIDLVAHDANDMAAADAGTDRVDLGLGAETLARVARGAAAYRDRARTVALVRGTPDVAFAALMRAIGRSKLSLAVMALVGVAHLVATTPDAHARYHAALCSRQDHMACLMAAAEIESSDPVYAAELRTRARGWPYHLE